jgi:oligoendopeptidase F
MENEMLKNTRAFVPRDFVVSDWETLKPYYDILLNTSIESTEELEAWLKKRSELDAIVEEDARWRYIRTTCDTVNKNYAEAYQFFVEKIQPQLMPVDFELNKKLTTCPFIDELDEKTYFVYIREVKNKIRLFREENIPLITDMQMKQQEYAEITGAMTIILNEKELTLPQAGKLLQEPDRNLREEVFTKIAARRLQDKEKLDDLFSKLVEIRNQVALNAGFENYRDYKFAELGRFDYTPDDCFAFHRAMEKSFLPVSGELLEEKKRELNLDSLRPWDADAEKKGQEPLKPFQKGEELLQKTNKIFYALDSYFGNCFFEMQKMNRLDVDSRKGKAPGGYNMSLPESGVPFIFMNAAGTLGDVITMVHEGGHAVHSFLSENLPLSYFKEYPSEVAEVASMSMELFTMEYWNEFFPNEKELNRAKKKELERVLSIFPWIATVDSFQHWIYTHPNHSQEERKENWLKILNRFSTKNIDWSGFDEMRAFSWQRQLHLFEVPFYYIEYAMAQLGAIALWKQFKENKPKALENYKRALSLGYMRPIREIYEAAGIEFDFSEKYVEELKDFVWKEYMSI